ncbi:MAG: phosphatase PAP2 family protein [Archangium sp.]
MILHSLVLAFALAAEPGDAPPPLPEDKPKTTVEPFDEKPTLSPVPVYEPRGLFVGEKWRYRQKQPFLPWLGSFALRTVADMVAVPASVVRWEFADYVSLGVGIAVPVGMSVPINGQSIDSRLQFAIRAGLGGPNCEYAAETHNSRLCDYPPMNRPRLWTLPSDDIIMAVVMGTPLLMMLIAALPEGGEPFVEASALALEALAVTQVYHLSLKLLTGREGPLARDGYGEYFGPTQVHFPDGTPSGHSATIFAVAGVYATYFNAPWLQAVILGSAGVLASFLMFDDAHFASEVIVGSAMGYLIGRWVVEHRSSRYAYGANGLPMRLAGVGPVAVRGQGAAFAATFRF